MEIWPYSFREFMKAKKRSIDQDLYDKKTEDLLRKAFHEYISEGGFPEIIPFDQSVKQKTLQEYLDVTLYRDIIERHTIKNPALIKYMILSLLHNVGKPFAINKFYNDLKSQGYQVGKDVLYDYSSYIEDAFLAFPIALYNTSIRKVQTNPKKIYAIDTGLVRSTTFDYKNDLGRLFENIVFLDLRRLGCKVSYYLSTDRYEVDFVAENSQGEKKLFQVTWEMEEKQTIEREKRALEAGINELKIPGEIITLDSYLRKGISPDFRGLSIGSAFSLPSVNRLLSRKNVVP